MATISPKYQIVIPKELRERFQIKPGDQWDFLAYGDEIHFVKKIDIREFRGILKGMKIDNIRDEEDRF